MRFAFLRLIILTSVLRVLSITLIMCCISFTCSDIISAIKLMSYSIISWYDHSSEFYVWSFWICSGKFCDFILSSGSLYKFDTIQGSCRTWPQNHVASLFWQANIYPWLSSFSLMTSPLPHRSTSGYCITGQVECYFLVQFIYQNFQHLIVSD